jgi:hypothetical protein
VFTLEGLRDAGFGGWLAVADLRGRLAEVPREPGVYVVCAPGGRPRAAKLSTGGRFKGRNPAVPVEILEARLGLPTPVLYIGKGDRLQRRLAQLLRFGAGEPIGHWGGRYLWQLEDAEQLLIAWRSDPDPLGAEGDLLRDFSAQFGALPFANLRYR